MFLATKKSEPHNYRYIAHVATPSPSPYLFIISLEEWIKIGCDFLFRQFHRRLRVIIFYFNIFFFFFHLHFPCVVNCLRCERMFFFSYRSCDVMRWSDFKKMFFHPKRSITILGYIFSRILLSAGMGVLCLKCCEEIHLLEFISSFVVLFFLRFRFYFYTGMI